MSTIFEKISSSPQGDCSICLEPLKSGMPCMSHGDRCTFHGACLTPWLTIDPTCPLCRRDVIHLSDSALETSNLRLEALRVAALLSNELRNALQQVVSLNQDQQNGLMAGILWISMQNESSIVTASFTDQEMEGFRMAFSLTERQRAFLKGISTWSDEQQDRFIDAVLMPDDQRDSEIIRDSLTQEQLENFTTVRSFSDEQRRNFPMGVFLRLAVRKGDLRAVDEILSRQFPIDRRSRGKAIVIAIESGYPEIARALLHSGAIDLASRDEAIAMAKNDAELLQLLSVEIDGS